MLKTLENILTFEDCKDSSEAFEIFKETKWYNPSFDYIVLVSYIGSGFQEQEQFGIFKLI